MSYLLTDVALQMMGYRFYNVQGEPEEMSIQFIKKGGENQAKAPKGEDKHLADILGIDLDQVERKSTGAKPKTDAGAGASTSKAAAGTTSNVVAGTTSKAAASTTSYAAAGTTSKAAAGTTPNAAAAIVVNESLRSKSFSDLSNQFKMISDDLKRTHDYVLEGIVDEKTSERVMHYFIQQEKQEMHRSLQITGIYRELFEQAIAKRNPESLAQYKAIFN